MSSIPLGAQTVKPHSKQLGGFKQKNMLLVSSGSTHEPFDHDSFSQSQIYGRDARHCTMPPQQCPPASETAYRQKPTNYYAHPLRGYHS